MVWARGQARWQDVGGLGGLFLVAALFMWPAWQQLDGLWYAPRAAFSDMTVTHWPNMWFVAQTFRQHGQIPLWRPLIMGGAPFVGNPLSALFYPPNWLFLVLPVTLAFHILIGLHLFAAGTLFYGLMRWSYGCSSFSAFVSGVGYMLTPKLVAHLGAGHIGLSQSFAWLPLTLWLLRSAIGRQSGARAAWCGAALAVTFLADPRVAFYDALLLGGYALYRLIGTWHSAGRRAGLALALRLLFVPLFFALIGAVQMLPTVELMSTTSRAGLTLDEAGRDSLPWRYLVGYLIADRGGYHEWMTYLGLAPLGLALWALGQSKVGERWFWAGLALACVLFSLGTHAPLYGLLYRLLPGLSWLRVPPRVLLLLALAANLLAALGADALLRCIPLGPRTRRWTRLGAVAGLLLCGGVGGGFALLLGEQMPAALVSFAAFGAGLMVVLLLAGWPAVPRVLMQVLLATILLLDLWTVGHSLWTLRPEAEVFAERAEAAAYLGAQEGLFRVYSPSYSIAQHVGARYGIEQVDGVDPSQLRWVTQFVSLAGGYTVGGYGVTIPYFPDDSDVYDVWRDAVPDAALLGVLNARFVVAEYPVDAPGLSFVTQAGSSAIYENERFLPRAFTVTYVEPVAGWQEAQARLAEGFDPASGALVEGGAALDGARGFWQAAVRDYTPNRIVVEAEVASPALLVLGEVWYPGWRVRVDGVRQPYYRVDGVVRGVYLDPGAHVIQWQYRPASLGWGMALTLAGLLGLFGLQRVDR
jgi:hypothetical protein